jgi:hypothetical protein
VVALLGAIGLGIARIAGREPSVGLFVAGAFMLAAAFFSSAADMDTRHYSVTHEEREYRVSQSFVYAGAGSALIGLGVLAEAV